MRALSRSHGACNRLLCTQLCNDLFYRLAVSKARRSIPSSRKSLNVRATAANYGKDFQDAEQRWKGQVRSGNVDKQRAVLIKESLHNLVDFVRCLVLLLSACKVLESNWQA